MERTSDECGLKHCTLRPPLISNSTHEESSWPDTRSRPDGSTHTAATGEPCVMKYLQFVLPHLHFSLVHITAHLLNVSHTFKIKTHWTWQYRQYVPVFWRNVLPLSSRPTHKTETCYTKTPLSSYLYTFMSHPWTQFLNVHYCMNFRFQIHPDYVLCLHWIPGKEVVNQKGTHQKWYSHQIREISITEPSQTKNERAQIRGGVKWQRALQQKGVNEGLGVTTCGKCA